MPSETSNACPLPDRNADEDVRRLLETVQAVAVMGMSPSPQRISGEIGRYLLEKGYRVIPIHPTAGEVEGQRAYKSLTDLPSNAAIDLVNVFVSAARAGAIADEAAGVGAKTIWFQPGAENPRAEARARELGLTVISGRCIMADHMRLLV